MPSWTKEQQVAIDLEGKNIIVSAGAGSGKTAVLTARVLRKLQQGVHINELLILTFTNAAAAEMKERIRATIRKTPGLEEEESLIDGAYITTFDSFSLSMVKKYHTRLNVTNQIKITDEVILDLKKNQLLEEIMESHYLSPKQNFNQLIHDFCLKDDQELKDAILNIYKKLELKYDKKEYLKTYIEHAFKEETLKKYSQEYFTYLDSYRNQIKQLLIELNDYFDGTYITKIEDCLAPLLQATTYEKMKANLDFRLPAVPKGSEEEGKRIKATITEMIKELKALTIYESEEEWLSDLNSTKGNVTCIVEILQELDYKLTKYKQQQEFYNFNDIAHLAIQVVEENEEIKQELRDSFNEILVDEYQDTSDTQEKFISLISKDNVYMVGDIKQSIYRFRNANPYIFKSKYDCYRDTEQGYKIDLNKNFRSRKEVLENINLLFDTFMDDEIGGADYKSSHRMIFGNNTYLEEGATTQDYNLEVLAYQEEKGTNITKEEQEIFIIGKDIQNKIENHYQIFDKDQKILREIEYSDFVILLDKSKSFDLYKKIFEYLHIPLSILKDEALRKDQDILVLKSLLKLLIRMKQKKEDELFQYSFISVARSFLFKIPDAEIYEYWLHQTYQQSELYKKCQKVLEEMDLMSASEYFLFILEAFHYEEKLITIGSVKSFRIRAEYFYNLIRGFEETGNTIYDFVAYLDEIFEKDFDLKFSVNTSSSNSCKIMTIHKSKGLEYPICYFAGFSGRFNISELKEKIIFDNRYGIILPKVAESYKDTLMKTLLKEKTKQEEISEKIRLLYVAVTRAKEKMIIVLPEQEEVRETLNFVPTYERKKYNSFLSIMKSIYSILIPYIKLVEETYTKEYLNSTATTKEQELLLENDDLMVTENEIDQNQQEEIHYSKEKTHLITSSEQQLMDFGIQLHEILEHLDFQNPKLESLEIEDLMKEKIQAFLNLSIIKENKTAKFYKEYEFMTNSNQSASHGIIDLLIETENKLIIIDYKLKNIEDEAYQDQLNGYKKAMMEKTNKPVECYLYSLLKEELKKVD